MEFEESGIIQLKEYRFFKTNLDVISDVLSKTPYEYVAKIGTSNIINKEKYVIFAMNVNGEIIQDNEAKVKYEVEICGFFSVFKDTIDSEAEKIIKSVGTVHLLSLVRSYLSSLTGLAHINPPINLPFFDLTKPKKREETDNAEEQKLNPLKE